MSCTLLQYAYQADHKIQWYAVRKPWTCDAAVSHIIINYWGLLPRFLSVNRKTDRQCIQSSTGYCTNVLKSLAEKFNLWRWLALGCWIPKDLMVINVRRSIVQQSAGDEGMVGDTDWGKRKEVWCRNGGRLLCMTCPIALYLQKMLDGWWKILFCLFRLHFEWMPTIFKCAFTG